MAEPGPKIADSIKTGGVKTRCQDAGKIATFADDLFNTERSRKAIPPLTARGNSLSRDDAHHIQLANIKRAERMGQVISGKKIGLTSPGIQQQPEVNEPDYGHLVAAPECKDGKINTAELLQARFPPRTPPRKATGSARDFHPLEK